MSVIHPHDREHTKTQSSAAATWRTVGRVAAIVAGVFLLLFILVLLFIDPLLNWYAKDKLTTAVNEKGGQELTVETLHYSLFDNALFLENIAYRRADTTQDGIDRLQIDAEYVAIGGAGWLGLLFGSGLDLEEVMVQSPQAVIVRAPGPAPTEEKAADTTSQQQGLSTLLARALPDRLLPLRVTQVLVENGRFAQRREGRAMADDSVGTLALTINDVAVNTTGATTKPDLYSTATLHASGLVWRMADSEYAAGADSLAFSSTFAASPADTRLELHTLSFAPVMSDAQFFARQKFRTVRFRVAVPRCTIRGAGLRSILERQFVQVRAVSLQQAEIDIVLNKRLPVNSAAPPPKMPHEIVADLASPFRIDTVAIDGATVRYSELFPYDDKPAVLNFTNVRVRCTDISHRPQTASKQKPVSLRASGNLAGAGKMNLDMTLPLHTSALEFTYSGELGPMKATALNEFLTVSDRIRIESGDVESAGFSIRVSGGRASGTVRAVYRDLNIQTLDEETGRAGGLVQSFKTFIANTFKIRVDNTPEDMKTGQVNYVRKPDDAFMDVVWLSVRGGLGDIVGF